MKNGSSPSTKSPDPKRYITPAAFSRMCGVSRQYLSQCFREKKLLKTTNGFVDMLDERTVLFLAQREGKMKPAANMEKAPSVPKTFVVVDDEDLGDADDDEDELGSNTGDNLLSLQKRKLKAERETREIEIAQIECPVIDQRIIASFIGELGQGIRLNFIDVCLRQSEQICAMLGAPGREREVQEYLEVDNGRRLEEVKRQVTKIMHTMKRKVRQEVER
jgi:hypothetical protein